MTVLDSNHILITDIGSTTTKVLLIEKTSDHWCFRSQVNVPTTVEKPDEDVKIGFLKAIRLLQQELNIQLLSPDGTPSVPCLATSSAGGGLQILVFGLSTLDTGKAAEMTAYGAGGVILRTFTIDDRVPAIDKMRLIRELHPDMILMAGGIDGGNIASVVRLAEILSLADPTPKFIQTEKIPLVFCGNIHARDFVSNVLEHNFDVHLVDNIRPVDRKLNTGPAKEKIHQLFMENVMERAPGYAGLKSWMSGDILPTPRGVENILRIYGEKSRCHVVAVDMGGATTDIFSNINGSCLRTVAANIGMSYSISNIVATAGIDAVMAHLPQNYPENDVRDYLANKMLNPTYVPGHESEIQVEQAAAIEGIRLAWRQHLEMNADRVGTGIMEKCLGMKNRDPDLEVFRAKLSDHAFQVSDIDVLIGSGGVFSFNRSREQVIGMLVDAFKPAGVTRLAVDTGFKSPHMGVLSTIDPELAYDLFTSECLQEIGMVLAPTGKMKPGKKVLTLIDRERSRELTVHGNEIVYLPDGGDYIIALGRRIRIPGRNDFTHISTPLPILLDCRGRGNHFIGKPLNSYRVPGFTTRETTFRTSIKRQPAEPYTGPYEHLRKLPYEGDIFVHEGDRVLPETVIGENRFSPPMIFIIDLQRLVGYNYPLTPEHIEAGLQIKVGDSINSGDCIFKATLNVPGGRYNCMSPVRGRVMHIESNGMIVVREIQDYSVKPLTIDIAGRMKIKPSHIRGYLKFRKGDFIQRGQALVKVHLRKPLIISPTTGVLKEVNRKTGNIVIQYDLKPVPMKALVPGTVARVENNFSAVIEGEGIILYGIIGFGKDTSGVLRVLPDPGQVDSDLCDSVIVTWEQVNARFLTACAESGVRGVIIPSILNSEWVAFSGREIGVALTGDEDIPLAVLVTEGFGANEMNSRYRNSLTDMESRIVSIRTRTQIRAGVTRPMVICGRHHPDAGSEFNPPSIDSDRSE